MASVAHGSLNIEEYLLEGFEFFKINSPLSDNLKRTFI